MLSTYRYVMWDFEEDSPHLYERNQKILVDYILRANGIHSIDLRTFPNDTRWRDLNYDTSEILFISRNEDSISAVENKGIKVIRFTTGPFDLPTSDYFMEVLTRTLPNDQIISALSDSDYDSPLSFAMSLLFYQVNHLKKLKSPDLFHQEILFLFSVVCQGIGAEIDRANQLDKEQKRLVLAQQQARLNKLSAVFLVVMKNDRRDQEHNTENAMQNWLQGFNPQIATHFTAVLNAESLRMETEWFYRAVMQEKLIFVPSVNQFISERAVDSRVNQFISERGLADVLAGLDKCGIDFRLRLKAKWLMREKVNWNRRTDILTSLLVDIDKSKEPHLTQLLKNKIKLKEGSEALALDPNDPYVAFVFYVLGQPGWEKQIPFAFKVEMRLPRLYGWLKSILNWFDSFFVNKVIPVARDGIKIPVSIKSTTAQLTETMVSPVIQPALVPQAPLQVLVLDSAEVGNGFLEMEMASSPISSAGDEDESVTSTPDEMAYEYGSTDVSSEPSPQSRVSSAVSSVGMTSPMSLSKTISAKDGSDDQTVELIEEVIGVKGNVTQPLTNNVLTSGQMFGRKFSLSKINLTQHNDVSSNHSVSPTQRILSAGPF